LFVSLAAEARGVKVGCREKNEEVVEREESRDSVMAR
jgi:hypothetical protein